MVHHPLHLRVICTAVLLRESTKKKPQQNEHLPYCFTNTTEHGIFQPYTVFSDFSMAVAGHRHGLLRHSNGLPWRCDGPAMGFHGTAMGFHGTTMGIAPVVALPCY